MDPFWHRGHLPHFEGGEIPQAITIRLADSLPVGVLAAREAEIATELASRQDEQRREHIQALLDRGIGVCWLAQPAVAEQVQKALLHFHGTRYWLHAWVIMPNHVHVLVTPKAEYLLSQLVHTWKSYSAKQVNRVLGRVGAVWQREYFDRAIRDERHFTAAVEYVHQNPVKAGLVDRAERWRWSSAWVGGTPTLQ